MPIKLVLSVVGRPVRSYDFNQDRIVCGRDPSSDIVVDHHAVSPRHFSIERLSNSVYQVVDQGSVTGTFLNKERVKAATFKPEDHIHFGTWCLRFRK